MLYQDVLTYPLQPEPTNFRAHGVAVSHSGAAVLPTHCPTENGAWRSSVARLLWEQEVPGSNPGAPTTKERALGPLFFAGRRSGNGVCPGDVRAARRPAIIRHAGQLLDQRGQHDAPGRTQRRAQLLPAAAPFPQT